MCDFAETETKKEITMKYKHIKSNEIEGELDIFVSHNEDEDDGVITKWNEILIHGNPEGLKSLAKLLLEIAELNQEEVEEKYLPIGAREHYHLTPNIELSKSSNSVIIGRLDAKGTSEYYSRFKPKDKIK
jgi:hypothetical protein